LLPPYTLNVSDYYNGTSEKLVLLVTNTDLNKPTLQVRYKLEGPEFGRKIRIIDRQTYSPAEFQNAIQNETFKVIDGPTGQIWKP
jgi:hypothetical protein